jgi:cell wall-associated NlpC family hydrolase
MIIQDQEAFVLTKEDILMVQIESFLGRPYYYGGDDPIKGFDCSGLVIELLKSIGILGGGVDMTAQGLADHFKADSETPVKFPNLVFFGKSRDQITHVGMALDDKYMVEAGGGNALTVSLEVAAQRNAYIRIRPIKNRSDFIATGNINLEG